MPRPNIGSVYPLRKDDPDGPWVADVQWGKGQGAPRVRRRAATRELAETERAKLIAARDAGYTADVYGLTVLDLLDAFFAAKASGDGVRPWVGSTYQTQAALAHKHILPRIGGAYLTNLDATICNHVVQQACGTAADPTPATGSHVYKLLRAALLWAHETRRILSVAWLPDVRAPRYKPVKREEFTADEVQRLITAAQTRPDAVLWLLYIERGLRSGEGRGLLWVDIDRAARLLYVRRTIEPARGGGRIVRRTKTERGVRAVPLSSLHLALLDAWRDALAEVKRVAGETWREHGLIFPGDTGAPMSPTTLHRRWRAVLRAASVPYRTVHCARHTATSRMLRVMGVAETAAIVGERPDNLLATYAHAQIEQARPALEKLDTRAVGE